VQLFTQYDVHLRPSCESCGAPNTSTNQWYAYNPTNLVQQIMNGNTNPSALAQAQAQAVANIIANQAANNNSNGNVHIYQSRMCVDCWTYWKKFSLFKFANARQERLNQLKNQVHKCSVNGCGKEFKMKQLLIKHCGTAHGYFAKTANPATTNNERPQAIRNRTAFFLLTTPMTKAARLVCTNTVKLARLAKKPFKLVELAELNKEWNAEKRDITAIMQKRGVLGGVGTSLVGSKAKQKLDVPRIDVIHKARSQKVVANGLNGHNGHGDNDSSSDLVIDNENGDESAPKPDYFKYFEQKCTTPCYTPTQFLFPKPSSGN
jgi:hypothetical protein